MPMVSLSVAPVPPVEGVDAAALLEAAEDAAGVEAAALLPLLLLPQPASRETVMSAARDRDKNFFILVPLFFNIVGTNFPVCILYKIAFHISRVFRTYFVFCRKSLQAFLQNSTFSYFFAPYFPMKPVSFRKVGLFSPVKILLIFPGFFAKVPVSNTFVFILKTKRFGVVRLKQYSGVVLSGPAPDRSTYPEDDRAPPDAPAALCCCDFSLYFLALESTTSFSRAVKSSMLMAPRSPSARWRGETVPFSISRSPTTSI